MNNCSYIDVLYSLTSSLHTNTNTRTHIIQVSSKSQAVIHTRATHYKYISTSSDSTVNNANENNVPFSLHRTVCISGSAKTDKTSSIENNKYIHNNNKIKKIKSIKWAQTQHGSINSRWKKQQINNQNIKKCSIGAIDKSIYMYHSDDVVWIKINDK